MPRPRAFNTINCNCGGCYTPYNERLHMLTKKHLRYVLSLDENTPEYLIQFDRVSYHIWTIAIKNYFKNNDSLLLYSMLLL